MSTKLIDTALVEKVAKLSRLKLTDKEVEKYVGEFNTILDYISQIDECDTEGIVEEHNLESFKQNFTLSEDVPNEEAVQTKKMLKNATKGREKNRYVVTSRILDSGS